MNVRGQRVSDPREGDGVLSHEQAGQVPTPSMQPWWRIWSASGKPRRGARRETSSSQGKRREGFARGWIWARSPRPLGPQREIFYNFQWPQEQAHVAMRRRRRPFVCAVHGAGAGLGSASLWHRRADHLARGEVLGGLYQCGGFGPGRSWLLLSPAAAHRGGRAYEFMLTGAL
jgi:hypothetical protein